MVRTCIAVAAAVLLSACRLGVSAGETQHETRSIDLDKSGMARVTLRMGAGELRVKSGTPKLLEAEFAYNVPEWRPVVEYRTEDSLGDLTISQPKGTGSTWGKTVCTWDLRLNEKVAMHLIADLGAGEANLELGRMDVRNLEIHIGAGELKLDLRGEPTHDYNVQIHGGVGEASVYLPRNAAISATASGGIGGVSTSGLEKRDGVWVNPEAAKSAPTVHLEARGGVGEVKLMR